MGCCLSKQKTSQLDPSHPIIPRSNHHHFGARNSLAVAELDPTSIGKTQPGASLLPHGLVVEEEFVKEVLSETPIVKPQPQPQPQPQPRKLILEKGNYFPLTLEPEAKVLYETPHISEAHEISESFSISTTTTTTTITEVREGDEAISKRRKLVGLRGKGSPANARRKVPNSELISGPKHKRPMSPAGRAEPSAEKRNRMEWSSIRRRNSGQMGNMQPQVGSTGDRRHTREVPRRRPRTPSNRMAGEASGGLINTSSLKETRRSGSGSMDMGVAREALNEDKDDKAFQLENECLENPVVSLECFIFL